MTRLRPAVRALAAFVLAMGVVCQFVQHTDPYPAAGYFTVWSAGLALMLLVGGGLRGTRPRTRLDDIATTGVVFSGLVYATVIAPSRPGGAWVLASDDTWASISTVLLHGVAPVLVLANHLLSGRVVKHPWREALISCAWPALYLVVITLVHALGGSAVPYEFLDPSKTPRLTVVAAVAGLALVFALLGRLLSAHPRPASRRDTGLPAR